MRYTAKSMELEGRTMVTRYVLKNGAVRVYRKKIDKANPLVKYLRRDGGNGADNEALREEVTHLRDEVLQVKALVRSLLDVWK